MGFVHKTNLYKKEDNSNSLTCRCIALKFLFVRNGKQHRQQNMETTGEMLMGESRFVYANKIAAFCTAAAKCQFTTVASV